MIRKVTSLAAAAALLMVVTPAMAATPGPSDGLSKIVQQEQATAAQLAALVRQTGADARLAVNTGEEKIDKLAQRYYRRGYYRAPYRSYYRPYRSYYRPYRSYYRGYGYPYGGYRGGGFYYGSPGFRIGIGF